MNSLFVQRRLQNLQMTFKRFNLVCESLDWNRFHFPFWKKDINFLSNPKSTCCRVYFKITMLSQNPLAFPTVIANARGRRSNNYLGKIMTMTYIWVDYKYMGYNYPKILQNLALYPVLEGYFKCHYCVDSTH